jgi:hypothetical protein
VKMTVVLLSGMVMLGCGGNDNSSPTAPTATPRPTPTPIPYPNVKGVWWTEQEKFATEGMAPIDIYGKGPTTWTIDYQDGNYFSGMYDNTFNLELRNKNYRFRNNQFKEKGVLEGTVEMDGRVSVRGIWGYYHGQMVGTRMSVKFRGRGKWITIVGHDTDPYILESEMTLTRVAKK